MSEPSLALQYAIYTTLTNDAGVTALVGSRVYDRVPPSPTYPLVMIGQDQVTDSLHECAEDCVEIYAQIDVWSESVGKVECKKIMGAIKHALHDADLGERAGFDIQDVTFDGSTIVMDEDGISTHGVMTFRALVETATE